MDHKLSGLRSCYVFMLMLLEFQWRPVFPAPTPSNCEDDLKMTKSLTELLKYETDVLLEEHIKFSQLDLKLALPEDVPDSTISGMNISEKLRDICSKDMLFRFHIAKVEEYQGIWGNYQPVMEPLTNVKYRLPYLSASLKKTVSNLDVDFSLPTQPAPPQLSHDHDYLKKRYCWGVIYALKDWLTNVLQVLQDNKVCDRDQWQSQEV